jgi:hypothetical protein
MGTSYGAAAVLSLEAGCFDLYNRWSWLSSLLHDKKVISKPPVSPSSYKEARALAGNLTPQTRGRGLRPCLRAPLRVFNDDGSSRPN